MILRYLYVAARYQEVRRFRAGARRSKQTQREVLLAKLRRNADSAFGREHGFTHIRSVEEFRRQVPLTTYEYYRPWVERVKQGDVRAMFGADEQLLMFALTSGTTSEAKFIPITKTFLEEYRRGWNRWGVANYYDHIRLVRQYTLQLTSDWRQFYTEGGIPCGNISGLAAETAPWVSRPIFIAPRALMKISDTTAKQYAALRITMCKANVGQIITANPSTLVEFARLADREKETLIRDIHDGSLDRKFNVPDAVRAALKRRIKRRRPKRARQLERIVEETGHLHPRDVWPRMSMIAVWTGGSVGAYLPRLREYYGDAPVRDHGLHASEGRTTIPLADGMRYGLLDYDTQFFEFIPEEEHDQADPTVLEAHELEEGRNYFVLLTTSGGLYRYDIHDLVRCVGFEGEAPLLEFLNKGAHFSSITGEKISENQVSTAVRRAFQDMDYSFDSFTVAPEWGDPPGYVLLIEPGDYMRRKGELGRRIDEHLGRLNCEYENRLETRRLRPMEVRELPAGAWERFRRQRVSRRGGSVEQYKHPNLVNDFDFAHQVAPEQSTPAVAARQAS